MRPAYLAAAAVSVIAPVAFAAPSWAQSFDDDPDRFTGSGSDGSLSVFAASSETTGDVSFLVSGSDFDPFMPIEINSPAVDAACTGDNFDGLTATTDRTGHVNLTASATDCVPGTYRISVSQLDTPFQTISETVTID